MAKQALPCPTVLRLLLRYEPETGKLFWKPRARCWFKSKRGHSVWNARYSGTEALAFKNGQGYGMGSVLKCRHMISHWAAWAITYGRYPEDNIDHINGDRSDNRLCNIRAVTHAENQRNMKKNHRNKSGQVGVFWLAAPKRWWAYIGSGETRETIGYFVNKDDAIAARLKAQAKAGFHPLHGLTAEERQAFAPDRILRPKRAG